MTRPDIVPALFQDAETDHPAIEQWCSTVLSGAPARLLLLGPHWSGKTHTAYAAVRRLLAAGYNSHEITVHGASELKRTYDPRVIANTTAVTVVDDVTVSVDLVREAKGPLAPDSVDVQAMMALEAGALAEAIASLIVLPNRSWILIAPSPEILAEAVGEQTAARILAVADTVELAQRPLPKLSW
ncbi:hypothetical protein [Actinacidiphila sp. ITFR-21]|uniref:hypothetical protein n=1 Tax=Actinacidiphila sp. ITFR-21 TaxID=3075199 RepID=UPI00288BD959|nr:hypothetical protein [Streptomyces sp. ITFR-21]WNI20012.1 hypothetical protein RLT57_31210 [Streptomyces sp. ITFR-21]